MSVDEARLNAFMEKFVHDIGAVMHAATVVVGDELGLYKAMAEKPMTADVLAQKTRTDVRYLRELRVNDPVRVTFQLLDHDSKRIHYFEQLFHATEGWVSATSENMTLHVDMAAKKTAPFPEAIMRSLARMKAAHARLPRPEAVGRRIAMPSKS